MALRDDLTKEIELRLGGQMVDVELDPEHYELSMDKSFEKYRFCIEFKCAHPLGFC